MPNSVPVGQSTAEIWQLLKMAAVRHLGFFVCVWTAHEEHLVVLIVVQNLVGCVVYEICEFVLEVPLHAPFGGVLGVKMELFAVLSL